MADKESKDPQEVSITGDNLQFMAETAWNAGYDGCLHDVKQLIGEEMFKRLNIGSNRGTVSIGFQVNGIVNVGSEGQAEA